MVLSKMANAGITSILHGTEPHVFEIKGCVVQIGTELESYLTLFCTVRDVFQCESNLL